MNNRNGFKKLITMLQWCVMVFIFTPHSNVFAQHVKVDIVDSSFIFDTAAFKACHASTIEKLSNGKLIAAWFGGDHEGSPDVCIWTAIRDKDDWTKPLKTADGIQPDGKQFACWNPVLFKGTNGTLYLYYKVGPNPREWWAMYKTSADNGSTWSGAQPLPSGFLGPIKNKPVQLANGSILYPSSIESKDEQHWTVHLEQSDAQLQHWKITNINNDTFQAIQPSLLFYPHNKMQLLARSKQNVIVQSWSEDNGQTWSPLTSTTLPNPNSGIDAVTVQNQYQLLVYNPLNAGKNWWEGRSVLKLAMSTDGEHWKDIYTFENQKRGEFSYPAIIADDAGNIYITYTYDRVKIKFFQLKMEGMD